MSGHEGFFTLISPSIAKNTLCVGATQNVQSSYPEGYATSYFLIDTPMIYYGKVIGMAIASFGVVPEQASVHPVLLGQFDCVSETYTNLGTNVNRNIILVQKSAVCSSAIKCKKAQDINASGCIIFDNVESFSIMEMSLDHTTGINIPCAFISKESGNFLENILHDNFCAIEFPFVKAANKGNLAMFSSKGSM